MYACTAFVANKLFRSMAVKLDLTPLKSTILGALSHLVSTSMARAPGRVYGWSCPTKNSVVIVPPK